MSKNCLVTNMNPLTPATPSIGSELRAFYVLAISLEPGDFLVKFSTFSLERLQCLTRVDVNAVKFHQRILLFNNLLLAFVCICSAIDKHDDTVRIQQYLLLIAAIIENCTTFPVVRINHEFLDLFHSILIMPIQAPYDMSYVRPTATQLVVRNVRDMVLELLSPLFKNLTMDHLRMTEFTQRSLFGRRCDHSEMKILRVTKRKTEERAEEIHAELVKYMIPDLVNIVEGYDPPQKYLDFLNNWHF